MLETLVPAPSCAAGTRSRWPHQPFSTPSRPLPSWCFAWPPPDRSAQVRPPGQPPGPCDVAASPRRERVLLLRPTWHRPDRYGSQRWLLAGAESRSLGHGGIR